MLTLYFAPGACSLAAHIVLEESGETYAARRVDFSNGEPLAENTAILPYLGKRFGRWPKDAVGEARALALIGFFAASVHPAHAHISRPERYATDTSSFPNIQEQGRKTFHLYLKEIDERLA